MNKYKELLREFLWGKVIEKWMITEKECGVQKNFFLFFNFKMGAFRIPLYAPRNDPIEIGMVI